MTSVSFFGFTCDHPGVRHSSEDRPRQTGQQWLNNVSKLSLKRCAMLMSTLVWPTPTFGWASSSPQFTTEEKAWIAAHPVVCTTIDPHWRGLNFGTTGR